MLETVLPRKLRVPSPPTMSRASSSSSTLSEASEAQDSSDGSSLVPLDAHDEDRHRHSIPEQSLRQRSTSSAAPSRSSSDAPNTGEDVLSSTEHEISKGGNTSPSIFRSILGASPFLMGPHMFSAADILQPPRARKESGERVDLERISRVTSSSKRHDVSRPDASPSRLLASPSPSTYGSSFQDEIGGEKHYSMDESATLSGVRCRQSSGLYQKGYAFVLRSRENIIIHCLMEAKMLTTDWPVLAFAIFYSFFHSAVTNLAYWQHARLNAANRVPLQDVAFDILPVIDGQWWIASEYIVWSLVAVCFSCILSNFVVKWNAPHGKPIYSVQIARRMGMTLVVCQTLRMISFLVTTLPGASRQCRYAVPDGLTSAEMLNGPAPSEGNPSGWAPPTELYDILFRLDCSNGCGDLMFSSHTIYSMTFVCIIFKYFNFWWLKSYMALGQVVIVPFILAARKHYTVDVFTALYVTPLVFEILSIRFPDRETSMDLAKHYGIRFYLAQEYHDSFCYVVSFWGREFYVDPDQLPVDVNERHNSKSSAFLADKNRENAGSTASIV